MKKKSIIIISFSVFLVLFLIMIILFLGQTGLLFSTDQIQVYFKNNNTSESYLIGAENRGVYLPKNYTLEDKVSSALEIIKKKPVSRKYSNVWINGLEIKDININSDIITLNFNWKFNDIEPADRTILMYCIVMTLCEFDNVEYVNFLCENQIPDGIENSKISLSDAIYKINIGNKQFLNLYFINSEKNALKEYKYSYTPVKNETPEKSVIKALIKGPSDIYEYTPSLPPDTVLKSIYIEERVCYVNIESNYFLNLQDTNRMEEMRIYSIVNSLTSLENIDKVKLRINNDIRREFGMINTDSFLEFNEEICN